MTQVFWVSADSVVGPHPAPRPPVSSFPTSVQCRSWLCVSVYSIRPSDYRPLHCPSPLTSRVEATHHLDNRYDSLPVVFFSSNPPPIPTPTSFARLKDLCPHLPSLDVSYPNRSFSRLPWGTGSPAWVTDVPGTPISTPSVVTVGRRSSPGATGGRFLFTVLLRESL